MGADLSVIMWHKKVESYRSPTKFGETTSQKGGFKILPSGLILTVINELISTREWTRLSNYDKCVQRGGCEV